MIRELRPRHPGLPVVRMCQLLGVSRSQWYRGSGGRPERAEFYRRLREELAIVANLHPGYGYRRARLEIARRGVACGYKSVSRAMRESGLGVRRKRRARTSDGLGAGAYPNLLASARLDGPAQAWVADIAWVGLPGGAAYLAVVMDAFLRKVVGKRLGPRPDACLTLGALEDALSRHPPKPGWDPPLGSRLAVPIEGVRGGGRGLGRPRQRLQEGLPLRQRGHGELLQNAQGRGGSTSKSTRASSMRASV